MTASGFLTVSPRVEGSMAPEIAKAVDALESFDVRYETTAMGTLLEAEEAATLFAAAQAAHEAVDSDRAVTFLKVDDKRATDDPMEEKVASVEDHLGRVPRSDTATDDDQDRPAGS
jgi:uncharacterized protein (TIGR00106 family)